MFCEHSPGFCHILPVCCKCRCQPVLPAFKDKNRRCKKMHVEKGREKNAGEMRDSVWQGIWRLEVVIHPVTQSSSLAQAVVCSCPLYAVWLFAILQFRKGEREAIQYACLPWGYRGTLMLSDDNNVVFDLYQWFATGFTSRLTFCFGHEANWLNTITEKVLEIQLMNIIWNCLGQTMCKINNMTYAGIKNGNTLE